MSFVEVKHVTKIFGPRPREALKRVKDGMDKETLLAETGHTLGLDDVSLSVERGEIFVVMGLSGSGKSTLIRHLNRLIDPTDGEILVDGVDILKLGARDLAAFRRRKTGMVFQHFGLLPHRTVIRNIAYGLEIQGVAREERERRAMAWLEQVGLSGYEHHYPSELSGGMQQRVGLARALCTDPEILLMDEAFSALDPLIRSQMQDQLIALQAKLKKTIIFITHDLDEALRLGDRIAILKDGRVSQIGTPPDILLKPADAYVRAFVKDVNRARVLTVEAVMKPPVLRLSDETLEEALAEMRRRGADYGYVVDEGSYSGVVTEAAVEKALAADGTPQISDIVVEAAQVDTGATLADALPATLTSKYPVAVVGENGELRGVVEPQELGEVLAPPQEEDAKDEAEGSRVAAAE